MRILAGLALAVTCLAAPAVASETPDEDKVVCKRERGASTLGSRMLKDKKVCMKASEWKTLERDNASAQRVMRDKLQTNGAPEIVTPR
jgi:hypothetical protein